MLGAGAREIAVEGDRVCGVRTSSGTVEGDWYISALPSYDLVAMLPQSLAEGDFFSRAKGLPYSPIVDVHIWYDRPVMDEVFSGFVDSPVQWVFNKTRMQGEDESSGQYLCISLSGAWEYADTPKQEIRDMFLEEMTRLFPQAQRRAGDAPADSEAAPRHLSLHSRRWPPPAAQRHAYLQPLSGRRVG